MKTQPKISIKAHQCWKNLKKFSKTPKPRFQKHEMHECERIRGLPSKEKLEKAWRILEKQLLEWDHSVFGRETEKYQERDRGKWVLDRTGSLNSVPINLDRWRCREVSRHLSRKVSRKWSPIDTGIEEVSRNKSSDTRSESRSIQQVSRSYWGGKSILDRSTKCWGVVGITIRKSWRSSTDSKVSRRCRVSF